MASGNGGPDLGSDARRPDDVCAHRHHASFEPPAERVFNPSRKETHWDVACWRVTNSGTPTAQGACLLDKAKIEDRLLTQL
jgi:pilus assembly protein Flp/PilA